MEQNAHILMTFCKMFDDFANVLLMLLQEQQNQNDMVINDIAVWPLQQATDQMGAAKFIPRKRSRRKRQWFWTKKYSWVKNQVTYLANLRLVVIEL